MRPKELRGGERSLTPAWSSVIPMGSFCSLLATQAETTESVVSGLELDGPCRIQPCSSALQPRLSETGCREKRCVSVDSGKGQLAVSPDRLATVGHSCGSERSYHSTGVKMGAGVP